MALPWAESSMSLRDVKTPIFFERWYQSIVVCLIGHKLAVVLGNAVRREVGLAESLKELRQEKNNAKQLFPLPDYLPVICGPLPVF